MKEYAPCCLNASETVNLHRPADLQRRMTRNRFLNRFHNVFAMLAMIRRAACDVVRILGVRTLYRMDDEDELGTE